MTQIKPRPKPPQMRIIRSAGAVVWRIRASKQEAYPDQQIFPENPGDIEVLLVHRPRFNDWSWPKGKHEFGESLPATAIREVEEETGLTVRLGAPLTTQRYRLGTGITKEVHYWVGSLDLNSGAIRMRPPVKPAPSAEIDRIQWVAPRHAFRLLNRRGDRRLLDELLLRLAAGRLVTRALVFTRHGSSDALPDSTSAQVNLAHPLNRRGIQQSLQLPTLYSAFGVEQLYSSPARRCLTTITPYATLSGLAVQRDQVLLGGDFKQAEAFREWLRSLLAQKDSSSVALSMHRNLLPALVGELALHSPSQLVSKLPQESHYLAHGASLVVHLAVAPHQPNLTKTTMDTADGSTRTTTSLPAMKVKIDGNGGVGRQHVAVTSNSRNPQVSGLAADRSVVVAKVSNNQVCTASSTALTATSTETDGDRGTRNASSAETGTSSASPASIARTMALMARAAREKSEATPPVNSTATPSTIHPDAVVAKEDRSRTMMEDLQLPDSSQLADFSTGSNLNDQSPLDNLSHPNLTDLSDDDWDSDDNLEMNEVVVSNDERLRVCDVEIYYMRQWPA